MESHCINSFLNKCNSCTKIKSFNMNAKKILPTLTAIYITVIHYKLDMSTKPEYPFWGTILNNKNTALKLQLICKIFSQFAYMKI